MHPRVQRIIDFCGQVDEALVTLTAQEESFVNAVVARATDIVQDFLDGGQQYFLAHPAEYQRLVNSNASVPTDVLIDALQDMGRTVYTRLQGLYPPIIFVSVLPLSPLDIGLTRGAAYGTLPPPAPVNMPGRISIDVLAFLPIEAFGDVPTLRAIESHFEIELIDSLTHEMTHYKQHLRHPHTRHLGNRLAQSLTRKGMVPPSPDDRQRDPLHGRKDPARVLGTPQTSRMNPQAEYHGQPEEIMGWAVGIAKTYSASKEYRNIETGMKKRDEMAGLTGHILTRLTYGSVPAKRFMRYLIDALRHYGTAPREINRFLVRAKRKAMTP